jgi:hypothetical protein
VAALADERGTESREGRAVGVRMKGGVVCFAGAIVVTVAGAGLAEPGRAAAGLKVLGRASRTVDNSGGANGARSVVVERGTFLYDNDGTITAADVGAQAYVLDDQTVTRTDGGGTRSPGGEIREVVPSGVWITIN